VVVTADHDVGRNHASVEEQGKKDEKRKQTVKIKILSRNHVSQHAGTEEAKKCPQNGNHNGNTVGGNKLPRTFKNIIICTQRKFTGNKRVTI
jgi:hypothetical protein